MYPDSEFARPVSSFRRPAPIVSVDPDSSPDVTVCFRHEWIPYIIGSLRQLLLQSTWDTTDRAVLNLMQARAQLLIAMFIEGCPPEQNTDGVEFDGEELMGSLCEALRFHDGKLQAYCCGEWGDVQGQAGAIAGAVTQPPPQAAPGTNDCLQFDVTLQGNSRYLLPVPVSAGYKITVSQATGGWSGGGLTWACPSGGVYGLGICGAPLATDAGDPIPTISHMRLVAQLQNANQWFDAYAGEYTVPVGVVNDQLVFQANDGTLGDNSGSVTFHVEVCNVSQQNDNWSIKMFSGFGPNSHIVTDGYGGGNAIYDTATDKWIGYTSGGIAYMGLHLLPTQPVFIDYLKVSMHAEVTQSSPALLVRVQVDGVPIQDLDRAAGTWDVSMEITTPFTVTSEMNLDGGAQGAADNMVYLEIRGHGYNPFA